VSPVPRPSTAEVISRVAHDLRGSLNAIAGWGGALEAAPLSPEDVQRAGAVVSRQAHAASRRLDLALDLWRLDLGLVDLTPAIVTARTMAFAAIGACADARRQREVACEAICADEAYLLVNGRRFVQALALLVDEAIANAPAGGRVEVRVEPHPGEVRFHIVPAGGTAPRERSWPFTRTLAAALLEAQQGRVETRDAGAFEVSMPCAPASALADPAQMPRDDG
jgi:signal transduction histidine kinase